MAIDLHALSLAEINRPYLFATFEIKLTVVVVKNRSILKSFSPERLGRNQSLISDLSVDNAAPAFKFNIFIFGGLDVARVQTVLVLFHLLLVKNRHPSRFSRILVSPYHKIIVHLFFLDLI